VSPSAKLKPESWVKEIDRAIRLDGRTKQDLINIIDWVYSPEGSFWQANIMSGAKLREKFDTMLMQSKTDRSGFKAKQSQNSMPDFDSWDKPLGYQASRDNGNVFEGVVLQ
jgi:hypothetical protein